MLLQAGSNPNATNKDAKPLLHVAAKQGSVTIVQQLLQYGVLASAELDVGRGQQDGRQVRAEALEMTLVERNDCAVKRAVKHALFDRQAVREVVEPGGVFGGLGGGLGQRLQLKLLEASVHEQAGRVGVGPERNDRAHRLQRLWHLQAVQLLELVLLGTRKAAQAGEDGAAEDQEAEELDVVRGDLLTLRDHHEPVLHDEHLAASTNAELKFVRKMGHVVLAVKREPSQTLRGEHVLRGVAGGVQQLDRRGGQVDEVDGGCARAVDVD